ncbi:ATP-binding protein [Mesoplasma florum]|uniref:ATP-binding protein n=1 Tax=Mesoplasma florum TaxID=2151 RepID=UPI000D023561|nr:ATP-binding protein [Mesoplasma florum]AVN59048.1 hypothetical protein CG009_02335 [Mesoplasma florum]
MKEKNIIKLKNKKIVTLIMAILFAIIFGSFAVSCQSLEKTSNASIVNDSFEKDNQGNIFFKFKITNVSIYDINVNKITFKLKDASGTNIGVVEKNIIQDLIVEHNTYKNIDIRITPSEANNLEWKTIVLDYWTCDFISLTKTYLTWIISISVAVLILLIITICLMIAEVEIMSSMVFWITLPSIIIPLAILGLQIITFPTILMISGVLVLLILIGISYIILNIWDDIEWFFEDAIDFIISIFYGLIYVITIPYYLITKKERPYYEYEEYDDHEYDDEEEYDNDEYDDEEYEDEHKKLKKVKTTKKANAQKKSIVTFKDVAGLEQVKEAFEEKVILPFAHKEIYEKLNKKIGGGILLYGPPGTGKTLFAEAASNEIDAYFIAIKCSDIKSKWYGESETKIHKIFTEARKYEKAIIFFDEFESIGATRKEENDMNSDLVTQILVEMQGVGNSSSKSTVMVIAATNKPWMIDSAFLRPGRFDEKIYVPLPDELARKAMFEIKLGDSPIKDLDWAFMVKKSEGYNGADITEIVEKMKMSVIKRVIKDKNNSSEIIQADVIEAFAKFKSSVSKEDIKRLTEFEEQNFN